METFRFLVLNVVLLPLVVVGDVVCSEVHQSFSIQLVVTNQQKVLKKSRTYKSSVPYCTVQSEYITVFLTIGVYFKTNGEFFLPLGHISYSTPHTVWNKNINLLNENTFLTKKFSHPYTCRGQIRRHTKARGM